MAGSRVTPPWLAVTGDMVPMRTAERTDPRLIDLLRSAQVTFVNLETAFTDRGAAGEKTLHHRADKSSVEVLSDFGIDVVTLANNHTMDFGPLGLADTLRALSQAHIAAVGAGNELSAAITPSLHHTHSGALGILGLSASLPPAFTAAPGRPGVAPIRVLQTAALDPVFLAEQPGVAPFMHTRAVEADVAAACEAIRSIRDTADSVIVGIHWGIPYGFAPQSYGILAEYQRPLAHALIDAGADIVAGHHPHYVQPIEVYRGRLIAYSLGNFLFHNWDELSEPAVSLSSSESELNLAIPTAPYRNSFSAEATQESVVLIIERLSSGLAVRFVPTVMKNGDPRVPDRERAARILDRLIVPGLPHWQGGDTPVVDVVDDAHWGTLIGELRLEAKP